MRWCDLYSRLMISLLICYGELAEAYDVVGKMNGMKSLYAGSVFKCRVW
ncbi:MAG: hypothetical protein ACT6FG_07465 [Methanosarcinaceae archaeon]